jgi:hypothetical protein
MASTSDDANGRCAQDGYYVHDRPKSGSVTSFRFPFVAYAKNGQVKVWGRTSDSRATGDHPAKGRRGWSKVKTLRADSHGISQAKWHSSDRKARLSRPHPGRRAFERLLAPKAARHLAPQHLGLRRHHPLPVLLTVS